MVEVDGWEPFGPVGVPLMVLLEAMSWYLKPIAPALRKAVGKEPWPKCSKGTCLAYTRKKATV
ncbi:hypothetical protein ACFQX6_11375 [Streptosporangium lutulentum]